MRVLVINTGSTSVRLADVSVASQGSTSHRHEAHPAAPASARRLLERFVGGAEAPDAIAHRVVHGGSDLVDSRIIDADIESRIEALAELAPLHNPVALEWIRACRSILDKPQVAVFDTAFFAAMPAVARRYALGAEPTERYGIRRYGFHGIAHRSMWRRWCQLRPDLPRGGRLITVQLGGGCSITACCQGAAMDTSMGFSPAEGLVMATRCGDIDAAAILHLERRGGMSTEDVERLLNQESGLLGLSGTSADMRDLLNSPGEQARLAVDLYCYRVRKYIGAYQAVLGGADGIVFGGGVGEHAPSVRARSLAHLEWCGIRLDEAANERAVGVESRISSADSPVQAFVIPPDEAAILAEEAYAALAGAPRPPA